MTEPTHPAALRAIAKLRQVLGKERADALVTKKMLELKLSTLDSADDRYRFGTALTRDGGLHEAIGRSIMVQAILQGAIAA